MMSCFFKLLVSFGFLIASPARSQDLYHHFDLENDPIITVATQNSQKNQLPHLGLSEKAVDIETEVFRPPEESTGDIVKTIRQAQQAVTLVCLGKAAADCLAALLIYPELQSKVRTFHSVDGQIHGSEKAKNTFPPLQLDQMQAGLFQSLLVAFQVLQSNWHWLIGNQRPMHQMNPKIRQSYLKKRDQQIKSLNKKVKIISWVSKKNPYGHIPYSRLVEIR